MKKVINILLLETEIKRINQIIAKNGWFVIRQNCSHMVMVHPTKKGQIVCSNHASHKVGKGWEKKIKKDAGIK